MTTSSELPITPLTMAILLSLASGDQHGYALMHEIESQTDGALRPGTGSLYAALQRLMEDRLIVESPDRPGPGEDKRRKYFRITAAGRAVAQEEAARMQRVIDTARAKALIPEMGALREAR